MASLTAQEAFDATNPNREAYNLPPDASDEQLQKARETAATNLLLGARAASQYWDSRNELEALKARAEGHGQLSVDLSNEPGTSTALAAPVVEGTVVEDAPEIDPAVRLRAQLLEAGLRPEA